MKVLAEKSILLIISIILLVLVIVMLTYAWFTRMTSVTDLQFDVARWDFSANYLEDDISLNVYRYTEVDNENGTLVAPGTSGEIPILLSAENSDTDIEYTIHVDKSYMSEEFQERLYFYEDEEMTKMIVYNVTPKGDEVSNVTGEIKAGGTKLVKVYWKWIYEFDDIPEGYEIQGETEDTFDAFDTAVGIRPDLYESQMVAVLKISGIQMEPNRVVEEPIVEP